MLPSMSMGDSDSGGTWMIVPPYHGSPRGYHDLLVGGFNPSEKY